MAVQISSAGRKKNRVEISPVTPNQPSNNLSSFKEEPRNRWCDCKGSVFFLKNVWEGKLIFLALQLCKSNVTCAEYCLEALNGQHAACTFGVVEAVWEQRLHSLKLT